MTDKKTDIIEQDVAKAVALQAELNDMMIDPRFQEFLTAQKQISEQIDATWKVIEGKMILGKVKSIKGEWGSVTIAERTLYKPESPDLAGVPSKYIKKVLDTTKISASAKLEDKLPKGVVAQEIQYLTKRIKG